MTLVDLCTLEACLEVQSLRLNRSGSIILMLNIKFNVFNCLIYKESVKKKSMLLAGTASGALEP